MPKKNPKARSQNLEAKSLHKPVLLNEVIEGLSLKKGDTLLDTTVNGGGHSSAVARQCGGVTLIGLDADKDALERAEKNIKGKIKLFNYNFRFLDRALAKVKTPKVNAILFDLGFSSDQLEDSGRGFSFQKDEPLLMTFDKEGKGMGFSAGTIVNTWELENLVAIIKSYGEEKQALRIAKAIIRAREESPIKTTKQLAEIIKAAVPAKDRFKRLHPATKTFQALRLTVNDELGALKEALPKAWAALKPAGRLVVISFHSLEDRIVKRFMKEKILIKEGSQVTKKPITASEAEVNRNPRSRSAKLRIIEKND